jgi:hypothetical protein
VGAATELDVLDARLAAERVRLEVVELQERTGRAAASGFGLESAASLVPAPDSSPHFGRYVA